jgi:DNA-binding MarR family transcriptional regulator
MNQGDDGQTARPSGTTDEVLMALRRIIRAIDLHSRDLIGNYGLTGPQLTVLRALDDGKGRPVGEVARAVHLSQATVTGIVVRLQKRGLVTRARGDADKRQVVVSPTPAAQEILAQAPPLLQVSFIEEFSKLQDWEQTQILSALQRVVAMMEARHLEATPMLATGPISATSEKTEAFLGQKPQDRGREAAADESAEPSDEAAAKP